MTVSNSIQMTERANAPDTPATNAWRVYFKSGGLYVVDDAGTETGPLGTGGGSSSPTTTAGDLIVRGASADERLAIGTAGQVLTVSGGVPTWAAASGGSGDLIIIRDEKTSGTDGGSSTSGSWQTRDLNTEVSDSGGHATLASNQVTLAAGTYEISAFAPAFYSGTHQARWQNITDATTEILGQNAQCVANTNATTTPAIVQGQFTIASSKTFELQHRVNASRASNGYGVSHGWGTEIYSVVVLRKVD